MDIDTIRQDLIPLNTIWKNESAQDLLMWAFKTFGREIILASSLGIQDQVLTDMIDQVKPDSEVFFLDTGRLHQQTYDTLEKSITRYRLKYKIYFPDNRDVEEFMRKEGPNCFFKTSALRKRCCEIRKLEPLKRALRGYKAWITGLQREQSISRSGVQKIEWDDLNNLIKINPLVDWGMNQVWDYVRTHDVPYNVLHDQGFPSIGCTPCTRAISPNESMRDGRWWWENTEKRECGLHQQDVRQNCKG